MKETMDRLEAHDFYLDTMRIRAFPSHKDVEDFIASHEKIFLVEQNRDAQLKTLLVNECEINPRKIISILHYDGTPITALFITSAILNQLTEPSEKL
jgi:2-oxoglutarate ferredoxin oxidoreductase subunit alpha